MSRHPVRRSRRLTTIVGALAAASLTLAACSGGSSGGGSGDVNPDYGFVTADQEADSPITVWVDSSREPLATAFQQAHPEIPINIETYDGGSGGSGSFQTKVSLFDQSGEGWPDVVFSSQQNDAAWASQENNGVQAFAAPLNKGFLDQSFLDGFTDGANNPMTVDNTVYGLRNDLAPVVLWYNKTLMDQFGYQIPTTWEEYQALSDKVAAEHPGYILGSLGDSYEAPYVYYWSGEAPIFQVDGQTFTSDFSDPNSQRVTDMLDHMLANGTMVTSSVFGSDFVSNYKDKLLATPGPAWYSGALFQNAESLNYAPGTIGVAPPLTWDGGDDVTGNVGGGVWYASSHTKNLAAVKAFLEFTISSDQAATLASGLPAYTSTADAWLQAQSTSGFYAGDFSGTLSTAASNVWQGWGFPSFSPETAYANIVIPAITAGDSVSSQVDAWQTEYQNEAQVQGYTVG